MKSALEHLDEQNDGDGEDDGDEEAKALLSRPQRAPYGTDYVLAKQG